MNPIAWLKSLSTLISSIDGSFWPATSAHRHQDGLVFVPDVHVRSEHQFVRISSDHGKHVSFDTDSGNEYKKVTISWSMALVDRTRWFACSTRSPWRDVVIRSLFCIKFHAHSAHKSRSIVKLFSALHTAAIVISASRNKR